MLLDKYNEAVDNLIHKVRTTQKDNILKAINRKHNFDDVKKAISRAKKMGFDNINVDLILGLPNVTKELLKKDIKNIVALDVQHISCYSLTVHEHTEFGIKNIEPANDDLMREYKDPYIAMLEARKGGSVYEEDITETLNKLHAYIPAKDDKKPKEKLK